MEALVQLVQSIYAVFGFLFKLMPVMFWEFLSIIYVLFASMTHFVVKEQPLANSKDEVRGKSRGCGRIRGSSRLET